MGLCNTFLTQKTLKSKASGTLPSPTPCLSLCSTPHPLAYHFAPPPPPCLHPLAYHFAPPPPPLPITLPPPPPCLPPCLSLCPLPLAYHFAPIRPETLDPPLKGGVMERSVGCGHHKKVTISCFVPCSGHRVPGRSQQVMSSGLLSS